MIADSEIRAVLFPPRESTPGYAAMGEDQGAYNATSLETEVLAGLPFDAIEGLVSSGIPRPEVLQVLMMADRTYARRKRELHLSVEESDRLVRAARVLALAVSVFESRPKAVEWLKRPNGVLGGARPLDKLATDIGSRRVEEILYRIDDVVYS